MERDQGDINYVLNFQLPEGYQVDDYPKSTTFKFSNYDLITLKNMVHYDESQRSFSLNSRFTTQTTLFAVKKNTTISVHFTNRYWKQQP